MKKLIMYFEEDFIKENLFLLKTDRYKFMTMRILSALFIAIILISIGIVLNKIDLFIIAPLIVFCIYEYPLFNLKFVKMENEKKIKRMFPSWVATIETIILSNTIPMTLKESIPTCPEIFKPDLIRLVDNVMIDPINKKYYIDFLKEYNNSDISEVMLALYQFNFAEKEELSFDLALLHERLEAILTTNRKELYKAKNNFFDMLLLIGPGIVSAWICFVSLYLCIISM